MPLEFKQKGIIQPLDEAIFRPDILDEKVWWHGYGPYFDKGHYPKYIIHDDEYYLKRPQLMEIIKKYYLKR